MYPPAWIGPILDEYEGLGQELIEILENLSGEDLVLELTAADYLVAGDQAQVSHSYLFGMRLFDK